MNRYSLKGLAQTRQKKRVNALQSVCTLACRNGGTCVTDPNDATRNVNSDLFS